MEIMTAEDVKKSLIQTMKTSPWIDSASSPGAFPSCSRARRSRRCRMRPLLPRRPRLRPAPAASGGCRRGRRRQEWELSRQGCAVVRSRHGDHDMGWQELERANNNRAPSRRALRELTPQYSRRSETSLTDKAYHDRHQRHPYSISRSGSAATQSIDINAFSPADPGDRVSEIDAHLCRHSVADAVYSAWRSLNAQNRLAAANDALEMESKQQYWNAQGTSVPARTHGKLPPLQQSGRSTKGGGRPRSLLRKPRPSRTPCA